MRPGYLIRVTFWLWEKAALRPWVCVTFIIAANAVLQLVAFRHYLTNDVINAFSPTAIDAYGYVALAKAVAAGGRLREVFADGWRLPGYPFFLAFFFSLFAQPLLVARLAQVVLSASAAGSSFLAVRRTTGSPRAGVLAASLVALWAPLYYFSPILYAESLSIFLFSILLYFIASIEQNGYLANAVWCGITVAALTYLKPNHITHAVLPAAAALVLLPNRRQFLAFTMTSTLTAAALISPWFAFMEVQSHRFPPPLSSFQGLNLYVGAGYVLPTSPTLCDPLYRRLYDPAEASRVGEVASSLPPMQQSQFLQRLAARRWRERPFLLSLLGACKILHGFGFSLQAPYQYLVALFSIASFAASVVLFRWRKYYHWVLVFWSAIALFAAQAFLFLPNIRFKVVVVDLPALVVCSLLAFEWMQRRDRGARCLAK